MPKRPAQVGKYIIEKPIGRGGMGEVYLAHDAETNAKVAVKMLPPELTLDPVYLNRFRREARAMGVLEHPNIVALLDVGAQDEHQFCVMEYVAGCTVETIIRTQKQLSHQQTLEIAIGVAEALGYAHAKGIVHRDIKPSNIMLTFDGVVKVTDFGIAKLTSATRMTATGDVLGTAEYMSPEQTRGAAIDFRSDLYSLGIVMFEMLTGKTPFEGSNSMDIMRHQQFTAAPRAKSVRQDTPPCLDAIIARLLEKEPQKRYQNTSSLITVMRNCLNTIAKEETTSLEQLRKTIALPAAGVAPEPVAPVAAQQQPQAAAQPAKKRLCTGCRQPVGADDLICVNCGTNLQTGKRFDLKVEHIPEAKKLADKKPFPAAAVFKHVLLVLPVLAIFTLSYYRGGTDYLLLALGGGALLGIVTSIGAYRKGESPASAFCTGCILGAALALAFKYFW